MNIIIYGAGAIGSHLAYCLNDNKNRIAIITKKKYLKIFKKNGINIKIFSNTELKKNLVIKENDKIKFYSDTRKLEKNFLSNIGAIFITLKLKDFQPTTEKKIFSLANTDTSIIAPCTHLSRWWFYSLFENQKLIHEYFKKPDFYLKFKKNIVGMTMWLSAKIVKPGFVEVKHIQRGYPIKEFYKKQSKNTDFLRKIIKKKCKSPKVLNVFSELYIKAINSFAFNLVALKKEFNNEQLLQDKESLRLIKNIFYEFDTIIKGLNLPILQSRMSRITQTLSSTKHTLSMLYDYQNKKKIELPYLWNTLELLSKVCKKDIKKTKLTYNEVLKKLN